MCVCVDAVLTWGWSVGGGSFHSDSCDLDSLAGTQWQLWEKGEKTKQKRALTFFFFFKHIVSHYPKLSETKMSK